MSLCFRSLQFLQSQYATRRKDSITQEAHLRQLRFHRVVDQGDQIIQLFEVLQETRSRELASSSTSTSSTFSIDCRMSCGRAASHDSLLASLKPDFFGKAVPCSDDQAYEMLHRYSHGLLTPERWLHCASRCRMQAGACTAQSRQLARSEPTAPQTKPTHRKSRFRKAASANPYLACWSTAWSRMLDAERRQPLQYLSKEVVTIGVQVGADGRQPF